MKAAEWIDRVKAVNGWDSDYRAAKELGVSRNTVSNYRSKADATMDDETAVKVAGALDVEPHIIVLDQVAERTKVESVRVGVAALLERIAGKVLAGGGGAGRGRLDITSVAARDPASAEVAVLQASRSRQYASCQPATGKGHAKPLQLLARALASMGAYSPALAAV